MRHSKKHLITLLILLLTIFLNTSLVFANSQATSTGSGGNVNSKANQGSMFDIKLENGKPKIDSLGSQEANQKKVINSFKKLAGTIGAIALPIFVIILVTLFIKISAESNSNKREEMIKHLGVVFIAIGLTALAGTIVVVAFKFF